MFQIKDKIVLVTGAAAGIGASVVRTLLQEDVKHITILDIDEKQGLAIKEELNNEHGIGRVKFIKCDITHEKELIRAFETVQGEQGYIDVVINSAGIFNDKFFVKEIEVNLTALVTSTLQAWDLMRKDKCGRGGTVINFASIAGIGHHPYAAVYSATKAAVVKFSTTLGDEIHCSRTGVRVLTVCFGPTSTQMIMNKKIDSFDPLNTELISSVLVAAKKQTPEKAAQGVIEMYKNGKSGSVWIVAQDKPAVDVTERYIQTNEVFNDIIYG